MKKLIVLCGPSHSGKSYYAAKLFVKGNYAIVNSDNIRMKLTGAYDMGDKEQEVWALFQKYKIDALKDGKNVILDACHMSIQARWYALRDCGYRCKTICVIFDVGLEELKRRCKGNGRIPEDIVESMWKVFQEKKPKRKELKEEGFDIVKTVKG